MTTDGGGHQLAVQLIPDGVDVAALFGAENITGAADFQITQGNAKTGAQLGIFFDGLESFGGDGINR